MISKSQIKLISSLSIKKYRDEAGLFVAEGEKLVDELIRSSFTIKSLYVTADCRLTHAQAEIITSAEMGRISGLRTASTMIAVVGIPQCTFDISVVKNELILALDDVQDPGNVGTIIRIADWFGIRHIICSPHTADCFNPKTVQATMGAIARVKLYYTPLAPVLTQCKESGMPLYGTFLQGANIYNEKLGEIGVIVMGSEGQGISPETERLITQKLYIPPYGQGDTSESLNVAVATAIACSEFRRRIL